MAKKPNPFAKVANKKMSPAADAKADAKVAAKGKGKAPPFGKVKK